MRPCSSSLVHVHVNVPESRRRLRSAPTWVPVNRRIRWQRSVVTSTGGASLPSGPPCIASAGGESTVPPGDEPQAVVRACSTSPISIGRSRTSRSTGPGLTASPTIVPTPARTRTWAPGEMLPRTATAPHACNGARKTGRVLETSRTVTPSLERALTEPPSSCSARTTSPTWRVAPGRTRNHSSGHDATASTIGTWSSPRKARTVAPLICPRRRMASLQREIPPTMTGGQRITGPSLGSAATRARPPARAVDSPRTIRRGPCDRNEHDAHSSGAQRRSPDDRRADRHRRPASQGCFGLSPVVDREFLVLHGASVAHFRDGVSVPWEPSRTLADSGFSAAASNRAASCRAASWPFVKRIPSGAPRSMGGARTAP